MDEQSCFFTDMRGLEVSVVVLIGACTLITMRILYVIYRSTKPLYSKPPGPLSILIVLGSGGHTAEMLNLLAVMQMDRFKPRYYVAAATDNVSLQKAEVLEDSFPEKAEAWVVGSSHFLHIYRSRENRPQVILCNGPGTCIPLCMIAFFFKVLGIRWSSIFYVESIARVRRLSLSGLILYKLRMADQIFVQRPQLKNKYPRANYVGRLM